MLLISAVLMANLPWPVAALLLGAVGQHYRQRFPAQPGLLLLEPGGRFSLPAEGRFGLSLDAASAIGDGWAELAFDDRPRARLLLLQDQFTDSGWRRLRLALSERG